MMLPFCFARLVFFPLSCSNFIISIIIILMTLRLSFTAAWLQDTLDIRLHVCVRVCAHRDANRPAHCLVVDLLIWVMIDNCPMHVDVHLRATRCGNNSSVGSLSYAAAAACIFVSVCLYVRACYVVTAIGSWRFLILLYIKLTLTVPASFPSVPNDHPHLCVCACMWSSVLKYECFPHTLCVILPHTHAHIRTHTRVYDGKHLQLLWSLWWWLLNALVLWGLTGVWELTKTCH